ncbi:MAG: hypothetical protein JNM00_07810 [Flavobacteriales bacterium]|nr:hypothetical protein [Flavobacteriales bacterium]
MKPVRLFLWMLPAIGLCACLEQENFPDEPVLEFSQFITSGDDSARMVINFTDGDGNFGLNPSDTTGEFCIDGCIRYWNLYLEYYELQNGTWTHIPLDPWNQIPFYYRVPFIAPTGQNKSQEGTMSIAMPFYYLLSEFDTARFQISAVDRDFNESNVVVSSTFVKP